MTPTAKVSVAVFSDKHGIRVAWRAPEDGGELCSFGSGIEKYLENEQSSEEYNASWVLEELVARDFDGYQYWFVELEALRYLNRVRDQFCQSPLRGLSFHNTEDAYKFCDFLKSLGPKILESFMNGGT